MILQRLFLGFVILPDASGSGAIRMCVWWRLLPIWLRVKTQETPGEHQNRWQMDVHPPQHGNPNMGSTYFGKWIHPPHGIAIGYAPHGHLPLSFPRLRFGQGRRRDAGGPPGGSQQGPRGMALSSIW